MCDSTPIGHWSNRCSGTGGVTGASGGAEVDLTGGGPPASDHKFPAALGPVDRPRLGYAASEDTLGWWAKSPSQSSGAASRGLARRGGGANNVPVP